MFPASILRLLLWRCPAAISRRVVSVVVDAIKRFAFWTSAHVGKKVFVLTPSTADADAATAISMISGVVGVFAALEHGRPPTIFRRDFAVPLICIPMSEVKTAIYLAVPASARARVLSTKVKTENVNRATAVTVAYPSRSTRTLRLSENNETTKSLTSKVNEFLGHGSLLERFALKWRPSVSPLGRCAVGG